MSGDAEQEYFSDGISEDLITDLSKISGLFVLARNSTFAYKGKPVDVRELSRRLNVRYVLEGSVRKAGARIRITAQLIDGENGGHVWAERFDRELTDIFAVQDEITRNIVDALKVRLLPAERQALAGQPTTNVEAYQLYLQGRQFFHRHDKRSYAVARRLFERACAIDPLVRARPGRDRRLRRLSLSPLRLRRLAVGHPGHQCARPGAAARPAGGARLARTGVLCPRALRGGRARVRDGAAPRSQPVRDLVLLRPRQVRRGQNGESGGAVRARCRDPARRLPGACACCTNIYRSLDRPADSRAAAAEALRRAERELERHPDNARAAYLGATMLAALGETERAREWLSHALSIEPDDFLALYNAACTYAQLGDLDSAIELLERALPSALEETKAWLRQDSDLDPLREHPRFVELLRRIEAQP